MSDYNTIARRQQAAQLLEAVINEQLSAQLAINRWPVLETNEDTSLDCAFWALWHFEADELQQQSETYYLDVQLELLKQIAQFLKDGSDVPLYITARYADHPSIRFYIQHSPWQSYKVRVSARWNRFLTLWQKVLRKF